MCHFSNNTQQQLPICHVLVEELNNSISVVAHTVEETRNGLSDYDAMIMTADLIRSSRPRNAGSMNGERNKKLESFSTHSIPPVICDLPFVGDTTYLHANYLFCVKPMHVLHLGVSWFLWGTIVELLCCITKKTDHYKSAQRSMRIRMYTFSRLRTIILREVNSIIDEFTTKSNCTEVGLYIRNTEGCPCFNAVFTDESLVGMIKAADIQNVT